MSLIVTSLGSYLVEFIIQASEKGACADVVFMLAESITFL
jgi:hypothetical protein